jgi:hypothetical protein
MASSTKNVKIGVCKVFYGGLDLGLTQGGVEVTVKTETHKVNVDQFGKTTINELLMGREIMAKVPMAETTLVNLVATMPGATMNTTGGTFATGTISVGTNPTAGTTVLINGTTVTFRAAGTAVAGNNECNLGATPAATATNLAAFVNASYALSGILTATAATSTVTLSARYRGTDGNAITLAAGTSGATVSGALLTGGAEPTAASLDAKTGTGLDLLAIARELRFHPTNKDGGDMNMSPAKPGYDRTDDFVIPLAATSGGLTFAYKLEDERIFNVEFTGYPDPDTNLLFRVGV